MCSVCSVRSGSGARTAQTGQDEDERTRCLTDMVVELLRESTFDQLRTKEQLGTYSAPGGGGRRVDGICCAHHPRAQGRTQTRRRLAGYVVQCAPRRNLSSLGVRFLLQSERPPAHLFERVMAFLERQAVRVCHVRGMPWSICVSEPRPRYYVERRCDARWRAGRDCCLFGGRVCGACQIARGPQARAGQAAATRGCAVL